MTVRRIPPWRWNLWGQWPPDGSSPQKALPTEEEIRAKADLPSEPNFGGRYLLEPHYSGDYRTELDFSRFNLSEANFSESNYSGADLRCADLGGAKLRGVKWDDNTTWPSPDRFKGAKNIPPALKKQLGL